ncbi:hypothetical protein [Streptomyces sparsogenes]|uniref:hypothetical protein n=1 Tax=Streptomyces sparsogenes TaxID=67365 RepID=UPI001301D228|nr:hypothetical protein [Streptomyces sparsogenes]
MPIRTVRMCTECDEPHEDEHGTRFFGVPAWMICLAACVAMPIALLAYTYTSR